MLVKNKTYVSYSTFDTFQVPCYKGQVPVGYLAIAVNKQCII